MKRDSWRESLSSDPHGLLFRSWLTEPDSLTARLLASCQSFRVRLVRQGWQKSLRDERNNAGQRQARVREVILECDACPVIFAHTRLLTATSGRLSVWLEGLGSRSLGSLLFAHPGFKRSSIEYCRLDARHPLYQRAARFASVPRFLWARRSRHRLGDQEVMVTEVFLPAILALGSTSQG